VHTLNNIPIYIFSVGVVHLVGKSCRRKKKNDKLRKPKRKSINIIKVLNKQLRTQQTKNSIPQGYRLQGGFE
jgi:hypothetical protein